MPEERSTASKACVCHETRHGVAMMQDSILRSSTPSELEILAGLICLTQNIARVSIPPGGVRSYTLRFVLACSQNDTSAARCTLIAISVARHTRFAFAGFLIVDDFLGLDSDMKDVGCTISLQLAFCTLLILANERTCETCLSS